jgi:hypothetical protein
MILTVREITLAMVQKAGMNLKGHRLGLGSGADVEGAVGGTGVVDMGTLAEFEPFRDGSLEWIDSSIFPEVNFFILLGSFWSGAGVAMRPPQS